MLRGSELTTPVSPDQVDSLRAVLQVIRERQPVGRPEIARTIDLGRAIVGVRVSQLIELGFIREKGFGASSGGRRAMDLELVRDAGYILTADLGATSITTGIADAAGSILSYTEEEAVIADGPRAILERVAARFDALVEQFDATTLLGIGVGLPGPVEFATGISVSPPIMPGWDGFNVREYFQSRYSAATWVDNDVNVMALAEARIGAARGTGDSIYVKVGTGIGAGLISQGALHRGARGSAGDIGHIPVSSDPAIVCACGNIGCLEAQAGGASLGRLATQRCRDGHNSTLCNMLQGRDALTARDVALAASQGDHDAMNLIQTAGRTLGTALAGLINFYNPDMIVIGGGVSQSGGQYLAAIRQAIYQRSLPLATRDLQVVLHALGAEVGVTGCALLVIEELMRPEVFTQWVTTGRPPLQ